MRIKDATLTAMTAVRDVHAVLGRLKFQPLETRVLVVRPRRRRVDHDRARCVTDVGDIVGRLDDSGARLVVDHDTDACRSVLVESVRGRCLVIATDVGYPMAHVHVLHVSDPDVFAAHAEEIRRHLTDGSGTRFVTVDARLVGGRPVPGALAVPVDVRRVYRPRTDGKGPLLPGDRLDNLYTELSLLRVSEIPNAQEELRQRLRPVISRLRRLQGADPEEG
jgi:hypothetical protein